MATKSDLNPGNGGKTHQQTEAPNALTTSQGIPVTDNQNQLKGRMVP